MPVRVSVCSFVNVSVYNFLTFQVLKICSIRHSFCFETLPSPSKLTLKKVTNRKTGVECFGLSASVLDCLHVESLKSSYSHFLHILQLVNLMFTMFNDPLKGSSLLDSALTKPKSPKVKSTQEQMWTCSRPRVDFHESIAAFTLLRGNLISYRSMNEGSSSHFRACLRRMRVETMQFSCWRWQKMKKRKSNST